MPSVERKPTELRQSLPSLPDEPIASVIITTYEDELYDDFAESVQSVINQDYRPLECVLVTETDYAYERVQDEFAHLDEVTHSHTTDVLNLSQARNHGAEIAQGDIYVFTDDDVIAPENWISSLVSAYTEHSAVAAGGRVDPVWCGGSEPKYLPDEFYWTVGAEPRRKRTVDGFVRNTYGCNISFRADVFEYLDGFDESFGKDHDLNLQGEETELSSRLYREYGERVYHIPTPALQHKVYKEQLEWSWLLDRAYWQGYTKRMMEHSVPESTDEEGDYLAHILGTALPRYITRGLMNASLSNLGSAVALLTLTVAVGLGYVVALVKHGSPDAVTQ